MLPLDFIATGLMCGGAPSTPPPPPPPPPQPAKQASRPANTEVKKRQNKTNTAAGPSAGSGFGGTLLTGSGGIGDASLSTGSSSLLG